LIWYDIFLTLGVLIGVVFSFLVFVTGKGDAMSGGGGVRTSFKGKASFDDLMSRMTLILGISFLVIMVVIDAIGNRTL
jgi:preprotein translocase subunit SecG